MNMITRRLRGKCRGILLDSRCFDFRSNEGEVISGVLDKGITEEWAKAILKLTDAEMEAEVDVSTGGPERCILIWIQPTSTTT